MCLQAVDARAKLALHLEAKRVTNSNEMLTEVRAAKAKLSSYDPWWGVEHGLLLLLCGSGAEDRAKDFLREAFPSAKGHKKISAVLPILKSFVGMDGVQIFAEQCSGECEVRDQACGCSGQ